jgi:cell division protein FtsW (lipid II flippase)
MPSFTKPGPIMRKANIIISILLAGFSAFYYYLITRLPDRNLPNTLGVDFVPRILVLGLVVLTVIMFLQNLFSKRTDDDDGSKKRTKESLTVIFRILLTLSVIILYIILMIRFGYLITTPFFMVIILWLAGCRHTRHLIVVPLLVSFIVYYVFYNFFHVPLP